MELHRRFVPRVISVVTDLADEIARPLRAAGSLSTLTCEQWAILVGWRRLHHGTFFIGDEVIGVFRSHPF